MANDRQFDLVFDVEAPRNRNVWFRPANILLRGTVRMDQLSTDKPNGALLLVGGVIPGMRMMVDTKGRKVTVIDRMTLDENKDKDRALRKLTTENDQYRRARFGRYEDDQTFDVPQAEWPSWLWHMRRLVDHRRLQVVRGNLPKYSDILKMGKVYLGDSCNVTPADKDKPFWVLDESDIPTYEELDGVAKQT